LSFKMVSVLFLICVLACAGPCAGANAARAANGSGASMESKGGLSKENGEEFRRALEEMAPLTIGWTSDARDRAIETDDGTIDPRDLAVLAVQRTSLPYRDELEKAWRKLPADGVNTPEMEMDRFENNLIERITDLVIQWRSGGRGGNETEESRETPGQP